jgi:hypothetical protein
VSFRRTKQTLSCLITGYLSWSPSEVICRNEEHHENVEGARNIDSSASGDSVHISLNQNVCRKRRQLLLLTFGLRVAYSWPTGCLKVCISLLPLTLFTFLYM